MLRIHLPIMERGTKGVRLTPLGNLTGLIDGLQPYLKGREVDIIRDRVIKNWEG